MSYTPAKSAELADLQFDAKSHKYTLKGVVVPSVTQALDQLSPFGWMPSEKLEEARIRGTLVHRLTEIADQGGDWVDDAYETNLIGYVDGWEAFKRDLGVVILGSEDRVFHTKYRYSGTYDRIVAIAQRPSFPYMLDIKTGAEHAQYALQLAAYVYAFNELRVVSNDGLGAVDVRCRAVVQLSEGGSYKFIEYKADELPRDFEVFRAALTINNWRVRHA